MNLWQQFTTWLCVYPIERGALLAETAALVVGGVWAWFARRSMKSMRRELIDEQKRTRDEITARLNRLPGLIGYDEASGYAIFGTKYGPLEINFHDPGLAGRQVADWISRNGLTAPIDHPGDQ